MKKKIPIGILEVLKEYPGRVKLVQGDEFLFSFRDIDPDSDFYFTLNAQEDDISAVEFKPSSPNSITTAAFGIDNINLKLTFRRWLECIVAYDEYDHFGDPILESYQNAFEQEFDILDEDADVAPFNFAQQVVLNERINALKLLIGKMKEESSEDKKMELSDLENDAESIQKNITKETKRKVIKRLARLLAKAQKIGLDVVQEVVVQIGAEVVKRILLP